MQMNKLQIYVGQRLKKGKINDLTIIIAICKEKTGCWVHYVNKIMAVLVTAISLKKITTICFLNKFIFLISTA